MRSHAIIVKAKAGGRMVSNQQVAFELKQRVVLSLNKLADRDTNYIGVEELENIVDSLGPEGITAFLSGIIETDSEQKSAVRKECVRIMGVLAKFHGGLLTPHLGKMVASIVKRLKDTDSVVRDACVETVGIFASNIVGCGGESESNGPFVVLTKPIFEALGEQNRYVQAGAALCLARAIDDTMKPPASILQPMLNRVIKLTKNPHFVAKPALIELLRSIIQAGGATTEHVLSGAMSSILDALKNTDWTTRKTASVALADIAMIGSSLMDSFKPICIPSLESCRFDKVKPVRDAVLHALQCWKSLPQVDSSDNSENGSSTKGLKNKRGPLSTRKTCPNNVQNHEFLKTDDWHIEISVPKAPIPSVGNNHAESEGSCVTMVFGSRSNAIQEDDNGYEDDDAKPEFSSISGSFETKHITAANGCLNEYDFMNREPGNVRTSNQHIDTEVQSDTQKVECSSLDCTVTDSSSRGSSNCCVDTSNKLTLIKKQLLEIESRQSSLLHHLQIFMGNSKDSLSELQSKVYNLESTVYKITQNLFQTGKHPSLTSSKILNKSHRLSSFNQLSTYTNCRQPSRLYAQSSDHWEETASLKSQSNCTVKEAAERWMDLNVNVTTSHTPTIFHRNSAHGLMNSGDYHKKQNQKSSTSNCNSSVRTNVSESKISFWKRIKEFMHARDIDAAYAEALSMGDVPFLVGLMDKTGPVLDRLSDETANGILCAIATLILDHRVMSSTTIPWLQQVVDLSTVIESNPLHLSTKVRRELLLSVQEATCMEFSNPVENESITQLSKKLRYLWLEDVAGETGNPRKFGQSKSVSVCQ